MGLPTPSRLCAARPPLARVFVSGKGLTREL